MLISTSPDGHVFQVEYAMEAVKRGKTTYACRPSDILSFSPDSQVLAYLDAC